MPKVKLEKSLEGSILDIGGGGEGIIGRIYCRRVTAIDTSREELNEAPDGPVKLVMDAAALKFDPGTFDHVTTFFSLMYMDRKTQEAVVREASRVLKPGGELHIWDTMIETACPEPFMIDLAIDANGETINTTYGIVKTDTQDKDLFINLCRGTGLTLAQETTDGPLLYLRFSKPAL